MGHKMHSHRQEGDRLTDRFLRVHFVLVIAGDRSPVGISGQGIFMNACNTAIYTLQCTVRSFRHEAVMVAHGPI